MPSASAGSGWQTIRRRERERERIPDPGGPSVPAADPVRISGDIESKIVITIDCAGIVDALIIKALRELIATNNKEVDPCPD
jgi:hypothetical protein